MTTKNNSISMKIFGDAEVTDRILQLISNELNTEIKITHEKGYTTKAGKEGRFTDVRFSHSS